MAEISGEYFVHGDQILKSDQFSEFYKTHGTSIYEVIRIIDGKLLFYDDHIERLKRSAFLAGYRLFLSDEQIHNRISQLIQMNRLRNGNVKIVFNYQPAEARIPGMFQAFLVKTRYPNRDLYNRGIATLTKSVVRENPNAKVFNQAVRSQTSALINDEIYEILLVNDQELLTEGSMSNLFFIKDERVYTAPLYLVLPGITRDYVLKSCQRLRLDIREEAISVDDIYQYDAAFISGTSPKVLPIRSIDRQNLDVQNKVLRSIMKTFDQILEENLKA